MKRNRLLIGSIACIFAFAVPCSVFAAGEVVEEEVVEEESNGSKMKKGAKDFFNGLKGSVKDAGSTVSTKAKSVTQAAYIGEWYFENGKYATMVDFEDDGTAKITQTKKVGENVWIGSYTVPSKGELVFHIQKENGKSVDKDWVFTYEADKKDYLILSCGSIPKDPNGYNFARLTLFTYVGED